MVIIGILAGFLVIINHYSPMEISLKTLRVGPIFCRYF